MKKAITAFIAVILAWNGWLTYKLYNTETPLVPNTPEENPGDTVIYNTVNGYTTDITQAIEKVQPALVLVTAVSPDERETYASGIIYQSNATETYIVTSAAAADGAELIKVTFDNYVEMEAEIVGTDPVSDVVLLSVHPEFSAGAIQLGNASLVKPGEYVFSLTGRNQRTQSSTTSFGVVSMEAQLPREFGEDASWIISTYMTDTVLSEYSNGAPILNLDGEMIGMLSRRLSRMESTANLSCAVSVQEIRLICDSLIRNGTVDRGYLGITGRNISDMTVYEKNTLGISLDQNTGIYCTGVEENSPAAVMGITEGYILLSVDEEELTNLSKLKEILYRHLPEDTIVIDVNNGTAELSVNVVLK